MHKYIHAHAYTHTLIIIHTHTHTHRHTRTVKNTLAHRYYNQNYFERNVKVGLNIILHDMQYKKILLLLESKKR